jgi:hypothetical protein
MQEMQEKTRRLFQMHPLLLSLNLDYPGLEEVRAAYEAGDIERALNELVAYYRVRPEPDPALLALPDPAAVAAAETALQHRFEFYNEPGTLPGERFDWTYKPGIDWEWTWALNRHQWWPTLASAYLATRDERYCQELDMLIRTWVEGHPPTVDDRAAWRTIEAGIRTYGAWPAILSAMKVSACISREAWLDYLSSIQDHAEFLLAHPKGGNWLLMETNGVLTCGLVFPEFKRAAGWVQTAVEIFEREMQAQVHPDGAQVEYSTGYHFVCLRNFEMALDKLNRAAAPPARLSAAFRARLVAMWEHVMYMLRPDGRIPMLNDADNRYVSADLLVAGEKHRRADFVYAATNGQRGNPPAYTSYRFPWERRAVLRSGWDANALYSMLEAAPFGYGHQHEDALTVELFAFGQPLIGAMGRYTYAQVPIRRYLTSSEGHNVLLIDGRGQDQRSLAAQLPQAASRPPLWLSQDETSDPWLSTPDLDVAYGCYSGPWSGGLEGVIWERWLAFLKPGEDRPGFWVIRDRVEGEGRHALTWLLHFFPGWITIDDQSANLVTDYGEGTGNLVVSFTQAGSAEFDAVRGQEDPPRGWYSDEYGQLEAAWEVRAERVVDLPYESYIALVPFQGDTVPQVSVQAIQGGVIVTINGTGWEVQF